MTWIWTHHWYVGQTTGVPINGDYPLYKNTAYSIELNAKVYIKSWGKEVAIMLEEDAFLTVKMRIYGSQTNKINTD